MAFEQATITARAAPVADADPTRSGIESFLRLLEIRDPATARHSRRVAMLVTALGERLGLPEADLRDLTRAGWLHDLGKIGVPDTILLKQGPLAPDEWKVMRCHPGWGADVLAGDPALAPVTLAVRSHHERWDGRGYPDRLRGDDIPLASRLVAICDALCAITEERPYRAPVEPGAALAILRAGAGTNFEAAVVDEVVALASARPDLVSAAPGTPPPAPPADPPVARGARFRRSEPQTTPGVGRALLAPDPLPALLQSRERALDLLAEPRPDPGKLAGAIESDPGLTAAVLRRANRDQPGATATVPAALELLGERAVSECLAGVAVFDILDRHRSARAQAEEFRRHAVLVRRATRLIATAIDHRAADELVVAALLHDVGKLVFAKGDPGYPRDVEVRARTIPDRVRAERVAYGLDHASATAVILRRWGLHKRVVSAAGSHHDPGDSPDAQVVQLADLLVHHAAGNAVGRAALMQVAGHLGLGLADVRALLFELDAPPSEPPRVSGDSPLTHSEVVVLRGVAAGRRNKEIADELGLSASTVRSHLFNTYAKLGVGDRARAVLVATDRGWI